MFHRRVRCRGGSLGRLLAVVVVGSVGVSGCVPATSPTPSARTSTGPTAVEAGKATVAPDLNPPSPDIVGAVPAGFGSWTEVFELQTRMNTAADRVSAAEGASFGLAGIVAAPEAGRLTVYWKGSPPAQTQRLIREITAGMPVDLRPARYSAFELAAVSRLVVTRPGVVSVAGNVDGSGITATVDGEVNVAEWGIDVPVTLKSGPRPFLVVCSRQEDCAPRWGGATYWSSGGVCNLGFTVWKDAPGGQVDDYMLSAGHCAELGDVATTPNGSFIGDVVADDDDRDTLLIKHPVRYQFEGRIFTGTFNAVSGYNRRVLGAFGNYVGAYVCTSGSYTGEHCGLKVDAVDLWLNAGGDVYAAVVSATSTTGGVAAGKGDSGGPVHVPIVDGVTYAMGTMTAASGEVPCPAGTPSTKCGSSVYYMDISASLGYYEAKIATGPGFVWPTYSPPP